MNSWLSMGDSVSQLLERENGTMSEIATMWHTCQPKKICEFLTDKIASQDGVYLENLIPVMVGIQSDFKTELREPLLKPSRSKDT